MRTVPPFFVFITAVVVNVSCRGAPSFPVRAAGLNGGQPHQKPQ